MCDIAEDKDSLAFQEMYEGWKETFLEEIGYEVMEYCRQYNPLLLSKGCVYDWVDAIWDQIDYNAEHMRIKDEEKDELSETEELVR